MEYVADGLGVELLRLLLVGMLTQSIRVTTCCSLADPARDLRMRAAFENDSAAPR